MAVETPLFYILELDFLLWVTDYSNPNMT
jgi:hypothetical protein